MKKEELHNKFYVLLCTGSICTLLFSKWLSSVCIILLCVNWVLEGNFKNKVFTISKNIPALLIIALFLFTVAGIFYTSDTTTCGFDIQKKLSLLVFGIILGSVNVFYKEDLRKLLQWLTLTVFASTVFCFAATLARFNHTHERWIFFYHALASPLHLHAVYFSVWVFLVIFFLLDEFSKENWKGFKLIGGYLLLAWLCCFLLLLASKLVISVFVISLLITFIFRLRNSYNFKPLLAFVMLTLVVSVVVLLTPNPISERFREIGLHKQIDSARITGTVISQLSDTSEAKYTDATYFNGLAFRKLLWKFGYQILNEKRAWLWGVSSGDSQRLLDDKMVAAHLYTGDKQTGTHGYLGYNFHNQFVENALQSGCISVITLLLLFGTLLFIAFRDGNLFMALFLLLFFSFFLTESALERQMGVVPFALFSLALCNTRAPWKQSD
jgi:O-antigen ligase